MSEVVEADGLDAGLLEGGLPRRPDLAPRGTRAPVEQETLPALRIGLQGDQGFVHVRFIGKPRGLPLFVL